MKKKLFTIAAVAIFSVFAVSCNCDRANENKEGTTEVTTQKAKYACEMKCETSDQPGKCSKCGMDMKEVD